MNIPIKYKRAETLKLCGPDNFNINKTGGSK